MRSSRWTFGGALLSALLLSVSAVSAQEAPGKQEFDKATTYFEAAEYEAALPYYQKAYELSGHRPSTTRALAQCERALKQYEGAIAHFEEYLASEPEDAKEIQATIKLLRQLQADQQSAATPPPESSAEPAPTPDDKEEPPPAELAPHVEVSTVPAGAESEAESQASESVLSSPILWIVAGAVVVASSVALGVALSGEGDVYGGSTGVVLRL